MQRGLEMRVVAVALAMCVGSFASCVFELGDVVEPAATGGGGAGAMGGGGGTGAAGGSASSERSRIDVDTSSLSGSHTDFPLLVEVGPSNVSYELAGADGADIRFFAEDGTTLLAHEVERWVPGGQSHVWVSLPVVDGANAVALWLHVGAANPPPPLETTAVWTAYGSVYHLADTLPGTVRDATAGGRDATPVMMTAANAAEGMIGQAFVFDGTLGASPNVLLGGDDLFRVPGGGVLTAELWFQRAATGDNNGYMFSLEGCCLGWGVRYLDAPVGLRSLVGVTNCCSGSATYAFAQFNLPGGDSDYDWHHYVSVMDRAGGLSTAYLDGVESVAEPIVATAGIHQGELRLGASFNGSDGFDGLLDEVRFSSRVVPADWIAFQYATMTGAAVTVGAPEAFP